ncbi:MAG: GGDEF domain-containing protein [Lachnospiraceae bacterium]|nr:GGDEF domain-containing protein [Lachnospiraceae bacterium]
MIYDFIQNNFILVANILFLVVFLRTNTVFDKEITRRFAVSILLLVIVTVAENIEYAMSLRAEPSMVRVWMSIIGYIVRPLIIYTLILILKYRSRKERTILAIPAIINGVVACTALFSDISFSYDEANEFVRGPLGFTPHICSGIYLLLILILSAQFFKERNYMEAGIIFAIVVTCGVATGLESVWHHQGLLRAASSLSITFFYLYFCAQSFKRDALTKVLNRHCFYRDAEKYKDKMIAVLSVDLNNLKRINDSEGHAAGDVAIFTTAECIRKNLLKGCFLYRTGGDEFMVLCPKHAASMEQLQTMMEKVYAEMKQTPYRCAIGMAEYRQGESFNSLCARADEAMYQKKTELKKQAE